jgi:TFIIF-interacting CTD phosphatase-like protein
VSQLEFFYTRDNCTIKLDYETCQYYGVKNLSKIRKKYDLDKVLIVDDVHLTAVNNYGNLVPIKPFTTNRKDTELLKLIDYLEKIKDAKKFRNIEKREWDNN